MPRTTVDSAMTATFLYALLHIHFIVLRFKLFGTVATKPCVRGAIATSEGVVHATLHGSGSVSSVHHWLPNRPQRTANSAESAFFSAEVMGDWLSRIAGVIKGDRYRPGDIYEDTRRILLKGKTPQSLVGSSRCRC